jgi:hypothetical protein
LKDSSSSVVRRRHAQRSRASASTRFLVVLLFAATAAITWQFARQQPVSSMSYAPAKPSPMRLNETDAKSQDYASFIASRPSRPSYLYSVVSGGIANAEELRQAMDRDPVVAREFAGFDFQRAHLVQVSEKQSMNVAYRVGDKVYWTRKKVALHPGETLISDGKIVARTRCGNRIAMAALGPPGLTDPVAADFDQPIFSNDMVTHEVLPQPEIYADALPVVPPVGAIAHDATTAKHAVPFFMLPLFALPGGAAAPVFGSPSGSGGGVRTPLAVAPEPGELILLSTGLVGVIWKVRKSRRKR